MADNLVVSLIVRGFDRASAPLRRVTRNFEMMKKASERANTAFAAGANLRQAAQGMDTFARAARKAVAAPISEFENFESAMSAVKAKSGSLASGEFEALTKVARDLGATTRYTATESANALEFMAQAGFNAAEQIETVPTVLNLATAAGTELGRTSDILTDIMGAFAKDTKQATDVADLMTVTMTGSNTTLETLFETMKLAGPQATDLGVSIKDVAVMAGVMGNAGIKGSLGGTALRAAMTRLVKPAGAAKDILKELKIETADAGGNFRGLTPLLQEVNEKTKAFGSLKRGRYLAELFGVRGMVGASNIVRSFDSGAFEELAKAADEMAGKTKLVAEIMDDNAKGATIRLTSSLSGLLTTIGEQLSPTLTALKIALTEITQGLTSWANANPKAAKSIAVAVAAVAALATGLTAATFALGATATAIGVLNIAMGGTQTGAQIMGGALRSVVGVVRLVATTIYTRAIPSVWAWTVSIATKAMPTFTAWAAAIYARVVPAIATFAVTIWTRALPALGAWIAKMWAAAPAAAAAAGPILAVAVAIGAVIAAIVQLVKHWDELDFAEGMRGIGESIEQTGVLSTLGDLFDPRTVLKDMGVIDAVQAPQVPPQGMAGAQEQNARVVVELADGLTARSSEASSGMTVETEMGDLLPVGGL